MEHWDAVIEFLGLEPITSKTRALPTLGWEASLQRPELPPPKKKFGKSIKNGVSLMKECFPLKRECCPLKKSVSLPKKGVV